MNNRNGLFRAIPIFDSELTDQEMRTFCVKHREGQGLVNYLYGYAEADEEKRLMRTYIVRDNFTDELAGYFSLKAGMISINEHKNGLRKSFDTLPGIELANFAVNNKYVEKHKKVRGYGRIIFAKLIMPIVEEVSNIIGVRLIYIFSLPFESLIKRYEQYGFKRLSIKQEEELHKRIKPNYDEGCIFMYQDLK